MSFKWGSDPKVGNVVILGECDYFLFYLWKIIAGETGKDVCFNCFRDYSILPKEDTRFLLCMRSKPGEEHQYLHIVPKDAITEGGIDPTQGDDEDA